MGNIFLKKSATIDMENVSIKALITLQIVYQVINLLHELSKLEFILKNKHHFLREE